jgi:hypothetical protein
MAVDNIAELMALHKHSYERILWYRSEIWKISLPLYTGLAGFIALTLGVEIKGLDKRLFIEITSVVGVTLIVLYGYYLNALIKAGISCNATVENRERHISRLLKVDKEPGFRVDEAYVDTSYGYLKGQRPDLMVLLVLFALALLTTAEICIVFR